MNNRDLEIKNEDHGPRTSKTRETKIKTNVVYLNQ